MKSIISLIIATSFGTGFLPALVRLPGKGGGLIGSLIALVIQVWMLGQGYGFLTALIVAIATFFIGWAVVHSAEDYIEKRWGARERHNGERTKHDYNEVNFDEVHGQFIAALPIFYFAGWFYDPALAVIGLIISFLAFRFFDVFKPWPIKKIEDVNWGRAWIVMFDDTLAGAFAAIAILGWIGWNWYAGTI